MRDEVEEGSRALEGGRWAWQPERDSPAHPQAAPSDELPLTHRHVQFSPTYSSNFSLPRTLCPRGWQPEISPGTGSFGCLGSSRKGQALEGS